MELVPTVTVDLPSVRNSRLTPLTAEVTLLLLDSIGMESMVYLAFCGVVTTV
ncbi:hypothetical protein D3C76_1665820 [compost metagenome]